jgi:hypothetical protein
MWTAIRPYRIGLIAGAVTGLTALVMSVPTEVKVIFAVTCVAALLVGLLSFAHDKYPEWLGRRIELKLAAQKAYDRTYSRLRSKLEGRLDGAGSMLAYYGRLLTEKSGVQLYGVSGPGTKLDPIPESELARCALSDNADALIRHGTKEPRYTQLTIGTGDFRRRLRELDQEVK